MASQIESSRVISRVRQGKHQADDHFHFLLSYGVVEIAILPEVMIPVNAGMDTTAEIGIENYLGVIIALLILGLTFACVIYTCCCHFKLVACLRRKFATERQGRENRRVDSGRNHQAGADLPLPPQREVDASPCLSDRLPPQREVDASPCLSDRLPPQREVDASPCLSDRLPQEYRCVPRDEPPITRMEAKGNIPIFEMPPC
ncbi:hypothetical protein CDAR_221341 [Caerostris darwini]|uniref:Uncharacterized protein n=1 Tax=Caerostris darwini TaxID=1538125 RepID=A0AAV4WLR7_9ARAC|nr:hypothetical protein CDAR_221341 [Caerostris darwini]